MTYDITMTPGGYMPVVHVSQGDDGRSVTFRIVDGPVTGAVTVKGMRPDGAAVTDALGTVSAVSQIAWSVDSDFTEIAGDCICEICVGGIGSQNFILRVEEAAQATDAPAPWSAVTITENGTYNVKPYAEAIVDTPEPSGTLDISTPGVHNVASYEKVRVNMVTPTGTKEIVVNGQYNVAQYESVNVAVPVTGMDYSIYDTAAAAGSKTLNIATQRLTGLAASAFANNEAIGEAIINAGIIGSRAFQNCVNLSTVTLMEPTEIEPVAFVGSNLYTLTIIGDVPTLASNSFTGTPINTPGSGAHIYVPADLVETYKSATNWAAYADYIEADPNE